MANYVLELVHTSVYGDAPSEKIQKKTHLGDNERQRLQLGAC